MNDDEIVAVFMDWKIDNSFPDKDHVYRLGGRIETKNTFKFSSSWDWLIPVYQKFRDLRFKDKRNSNTQLDLKHSVLLAINVGSIEVAYKQLVQAIQWYNLVAKERESC